MSINPITNYFNTTAALGYRAGPQITVNEQINTDNLYNTYLGANTDILGTTTILNSTAIGYNAQITESNQIVLGTISENISIPGPYVGIGTYNPTNALALDVSGNVNVSNGNISGSILTPSNQIQIQNGGTITSNYAGGSVTLLGPTATLFEANTFTGNFQPTIKIFTNNSTGSGSTIQCSTSKFIGNLGSKNYKYNIPFNSVVTLDSNGTNWIISSLTDYSSIFSENKPLNNLNVQVGQTNLLGNVNIQNFINITTDNGYGPLTNPSSQVQFSNGSGSPVNVPVNTITDINSTMWVLPTGQTFMTVNNTTQDDIIFSYIVIGGGGSGGSGGTGGGVNGTVFNLNLPGSGGGGGGGGGIGIGTFTCSSASTNGFVIIVGSGGLGETQTSIGKNGGSSSITLCTNDTFHTICEVSGGQAGCGANDGLGYYITDNGFYTNVISNTALGGIGGSVTTVNTSQSNYNDLFFCRLNGSNGGNGGVFNILKKDDSTSGSQGNPGPAWEGDSGEINTALQFFLPNSILFFSGGGGGGGSGSYGSYGWEGGGGTPNFPTGYIAGNNDLGSLASILSPAGIPSAGIGGGSWCGPNSSFDSAQGTTGNMQGSGGGGGGGGNDVTGCWNNLGGNGGDGVVIIWSNQSISTTQTANMDINGTLNVNSLSASTISSITSNTGTVTDAGGGGAFYAFNSPSGILTFNQPTPGNPVTALLIANSTSDYGNSNTVDGNCAYSYTGLYTATMDSQNNISINLQWITDSGLCCAVYCPTNNSTTTSNNVYGAGNTTTSLYAGLSDGTYNLLNNSLLGQIGVTVTYYSNQNVTANIIYIG